MADFCITHVRYNTDKTHITFLKVREEIAGDKRIQLGTPRTVARGFVADLIRLEKATFRTAVKTGEREYVFGARVNLYNKVYLTTDSNSTDSDNLGNLPEF